MMLNEQMTELVAIGASIASHCQPCLAHHVDEARKLGVSEDDIKAAISVGHMVQKGAMGEMKKLSAQLFNQAPPKGEGCCAGKKSNCCG